MDKAVAELNIEHYRKLLASGLDEAKRKTVESLLTAEEAKLAQIKATRAGDKSSKQG